MNATPSVRTVNSTCGLPREDSFDIFRDPVKSDLPWPGVLFHVTFGAIWYFSCDQVLTFLLLNTTCPVLANSVDPDQLASEEANGSGSALFVIKHVNFYKKFG